MTIPAEAVEAAVDALVASKLGDHPGINGEEFVEAAMAALEAAAPYMLAGGTVTTEEELDALPVGSVVLSEEVTHHEGGWPLSYQRWQDGDWHRGARSGSTHPDNFLPAVVLHAPYMLDNEGEK